MSLFPVIAVCCIGLALGHKPSQPTKRKNYELPKRDLLWLDVVLTEDPSNIDDLSIMMGTEGDDDDVKSPEYQKPLKKYAITLKRLLKAKNYTPMKKFLVGERMRFKSVIAMTYKPDNQKPSCSIFIYVKKGDVRLIGKPYCDEADP